MPHPRFSNEEIAQQGEEIYTTRLRGQLEDHYEGQAIVIDIETGEYELGYDSRAATKRALAKHPGAALYGLRVGSDVVEILGSGLRQTMQ